jgi:hypothetical protein
MRVRLEKDLAWGNLPVGESVGSAMLVALVAACVILSKMFVSASEFACFRRLAQNATIDVDGFLSPVRLPVSPPGLKRLKRQK